MDKYYIKKKDRKQSDGIPLHLFNDSEMFQSDLMLIKHCNT